jgi:very-short-patch-repair endonuclease
MAHLTAAAHRLFATQHGVASVDQLVHSGLTKRRIKRLEQHGAIVGVLRGAYRSASQDLDEFGRCAAVCLARTDVTIAGPSAGRIWGFRRLPRDGRIHVLAPPASNPAIARWVSTYHTAAIHEHDVIRRPDGIRVTTRARTAFDLARWLGPDDLLSVIEQAIRDGGLTEAELLDVAVDWLSPHRKWATMFLRQLARRLDGGAADSHPEVRFGEALERRGLTGVARQLPVDLPGYGRAYFDLAVPRLHLAIEVDVHPSHEETIGIFSDRRRDRAAASVGWKMHRVSRSDYEDAFDRAVSTVVDLYHQLDRQRRGLAVPAPSGSRDR